MTLLKNSKVDFIQGDHCKRCWTTAVGFCSWREILGSTPNTSKKSENLQSRNKVGSVDERKVNIWDKGGFWLNQPHRFLAEGRPVWSDIT